MIDSYRITEKTLIRNAIIIMPNRMVILIAGAHIKVFFLIVYNIVTNRV